MAQPIPACPHCGAATRPNARFCPVCGRSIATERTCPHCGSRTSANAVFCGECGNPIEASSRPSIPAQSSWSPPQAAVHIPQASRPECAKPKKAFLILGSCAGVIMLCLIGAVGFYFAFRSGVITKKQLLNLVGIGPGTIKAMNLRDDQIRVVLTPIKESDAVEPDEATYNLDSFAITSHDTKDAGRYRVEYQTKSGLMRSSCALTVRGGDQYRFVFLPNGTLLLRENSPSNDPKDLIPETSAFCR